jgi:dTMP kinase
MRGLFITFEGCEGCGKSTQVKLLKEALEGLGKSCLTTREPGGPPVAEAIRTILLDPAYPEMLPETELLLYNASRSQHTGQWIIPALMRGEIVLCDRYFDSTIAYQGAARSLDQKFIELLTAFATYSTTPDITFLIDLPVEEGLARISDRNLDRLEKEHLSFHQKVREQYLKLAREHNSRYTVINGSLEPQAIHAEILAIVLSRTGA